MQEYFANFIKKGRSEWGRSSEVADGGGWEGGAGVMHINVESRAEV